MELTLISGILQCLVGPCYLILIDRVFSVGRSLVAEIFHCVFQLMLKRFSHFHRSFFSHVNTHTANWHGFHLKMFFTNISQKSASYFQMFLCNCTRSVYTHFDILRTPFATMVNKLCLLYQNCLLGGIHQGRQKKFWAPMQSSFGPLESLKLVMTFLLVSISASNTLDGPPPAFRLVQGQ